MQGAPEGVNLMGYAAERCAICQPGKTRTAGWQRSANARALARSTPRLTRPFSMLEMVDCPMPHSSANWVWLSSCSSRMIRTDSPGRDVYAFFCGAVMMHLASPVVMSAYANDPHQQSGRTSAPNHPSNPSRKIQHLAGKVPSIPANGVVDWAVKVPVLRLKVP